MSNPTNAVWQLESDLDGQSQSGLIAFTGVDPIRFDGGLWLEQSTTNLVSNPFAWNGATHITSFGFGALTGASTDKPDFSPRCLKVVATGDNHGANFQNPSVLSITGTPQTYVGRIAAVGAGTVRARINARYGDATEDNGTWTSAVALDADDPTEFICPSLAINTAKTLVRLDVECRTSGAQNVTFYLAFAQIELATYATSAAPVVDGSGTPITGYAYTGTPHNSTSTRAASSASLTIDEPVSVACWYREGYSGAKQFAYLDTLGQLGDYGDISYAAGDLTISTSRNLVIGPFATFDRALTEDEQARLAATQNWSLSTVLPGGGFGQMQRARLRACSFMGVR